MQNLFLRAGRRNVPISVLLEVNHRCHLACVQCYLEDNHDNSTLARQLSYQEITGIIDEVAEMGCLFLTLSGGEIFLRKDTLDIARYARGRGIAVRLFTSGTLLDRPLVQELAELLPASIEITLYSMDAQVHDGITGSPGSWAKTVGGARLCHAEELPLVLKTPLMKQNFSGYKAIRDFARELGASYRCDPNITPRHDGDLEPLAYRLSPMQLAELYADRAMEGSVVSCSSDSPDPSGQVCAIGQRSCVISPFGDVTPCMEVHEVAGNLRQQSFRWIWQSSPVFVRLRQLAYRDLSVCGGCTKASYCNRCNGVAMKEDGDFFGPSTWACTNAAAKELAAGVDPSATSVGFVPLALLRRTKVASHPG